MRRAILLLWAIFISGCATNMKAPTATPSPPAPAASPAPAPRPLSESIHWVRDSAEYRAAVIQTYALATREIERQAAATRPRPWAVILDADETTLDNSQYQKEREEKGLRFTSESWAEWVKREAAPPAPGVVPFLSRVRELGGKIAIVTNRNESLCPESEADFRRHRIPYDVMLCQPDGAPGDKGPRFAKIANGTAAPGLPPLEVLMFVGDNILDFPGLSQALRLQPESAFAEFGTRFFIVPNPMYGSWEKNPPR